ncbi:MAG: NAD(P)H-binding protein [Chitinophagales bacterium]
MKTALLFGATGLVGNELLRKIVDDAHYNAIKVFVRRNIRIQNLHAEIHLIDPENLSEYSDLFQGDDCFCCLGTTMKKAGSKENFRKVDLEMVVNIAQLVRKNGVKRFIVISSLGADKSSSNFYLKTKGEMEEALQKISFDQLIILRPSILVGKRKEWRAGESIGILIGRLFSPFMIGPLKKYKPIYVKSIARAILRIVSSRNQKNIYESDELRRLGRS